MDSLEIGFEKRLRYEDQIVNVYWLSLFDFEKLTKNQLHEYKSNSRCRKLRLHEYPELLFKYPEKY